MSDFKQVIVIRKDLNMRKGKMIAQGAHASRGAAQFSNNVDLWEIEGETKIVVGVNSSDKLESIYQKANNAGLPAKLIRDRGHTELEPGTTTAVGIGPCKSEDVDDITGNLSLL